MNIIDKIVANYNVTPYKIAVSILDSTDAVSDYTYRGLFKDVFKVCNVLKECKYASGRLTAGLIMSNSYEWVVADLALMILNSTEVPVPLAFSAEQSFNLLKESDICLTDSLGREKLNEWKASEIKLSDLSIIEIDEVIKNDLAESGNEWDDLKINEDFICKIVHTSGTTSHPKGVKIGYAGLGNLLDSLMKSLPKEVSERYFSIVSLSLLIEQVAAVYLTLMQGGTLILQDKTKQLLGAKNASAKDFLPVIKQAKPTAIAIPPSIVESLHSFIIENPHLQDEELSQRLFGKNTPPYLSCGGAPVSKSIITELNRRKIKIYEGYGLSENSSVVSINTPEAYKEGTVGKPLAHVKVKLADDSELLVKSTSLFLGYTSEDPSSCSFTEDRWLKTGDLAEIDTEGFITITGRKKCIIITSNGRNVAPEWVESKYKKLGFLQEIVVVGNDQEILEAIVILKDHPSPDCLDKLVAFGKENLSDVERVDKFYFINSDDDFYKTYFTITGRPRRKALAEYITKTFK